jgi:2-methylcitrate dehydratase PrpD
VGSLDCNFEALTDRVGERWRVEEVAYKPYPACRFLNPAIDMFLDLRAKHDLSLDEIDHIDVTVHGAAVAKNMDKSSVGSMVDACFSAPYLLAASALAGPPGPAWHAPEAREDPRIKAFAAKVSVRPELGASIAAAEDLRSRGHVARLPSTLRIQARGQVFEARSDYARGDPFTPETTFDDVEIEQKFRDFCAEKLGIERTSAAIDLIRNLEGISSVHEVIAQLRALTT